MRGLRPFVTEVWKAEQFARLHRGNVGVGATEELCVAFGNDGDGVGYDRQIRLTLDREIICGTARLLAPLDFLLVPSSSVFLMPPASTQRQTVKRFGSRYFVRPFPQPVAWIGLTSESWRWLGGRGHQSVAQRERGWNARILTSGRPGIYRRAGRQHRGLTLRLNDSTSPKCRARTFSVISDSLAISIWRVAPNQKVQGGRMGRPVAQSCWPLGQNAYCEQLNLPPDHH